MNIAAISTKDQVKSLSSDELRKKIQDYKKDNEYLARMSAYNATRIQMIQDGIEAERIR